VIFGIRRYLRRKLVPDKGAEYKSIEAIAYGSFEQRHEMLISPNSDCQILVAINPG
jgi:hypothetical protein